MSGGWMRLDAGFWHDEKFLAVIKAKGEAGAFKLLKLYSLASSKYGVIDLNDAIVRPWVEDEMGLRGKKLDDFLRTLAECHAINGEMLKMGKITSDRLSREGLKKLELQEKRRLAGQASAEKRASK